MQKIYIIYCEKYSSLECKHTKLEFVIEQKKL